MSKTPSKKTALLTGAVGGIGRAVAQKFAAEGITGAGIDGFPGGVVGFR